MLRRLTTLAMVRKSAYVPTSTTKELEVFKKRYVQPAIPPTLPS